MFVVRSLNSCIAGLRRCGVTEESVVGVTIGQFDAFHIGHQALIKTLNAELEKRTPHVESSIPPSPVRPPHRSTCRVLLTFAPPPRRVLAGVSRRALPDHPEFWSVNSLRDRIEFARQAGFDLFFIARFNQRFAKLSPERFIRDYLVFALSARVVVVGSDWGFGQGRKGNVSLLQQSGKSSWFDVRAVEPILIDGERVSTSAIKDALQAGNLEKVHRFLGRRFSLSSRVRHGAARGHNLGFPTANLEPFAQLLPNDGVYATRATIEGEVFPAATNVGIQPTFNGTKRIVEAHLLPNPVTQKSPPNSFYGKRLVVEFIDYLRPEKKFEGVASLQSAIQNDVERTREIFSRESK